MADRLGFRDADWPEAIEIVNPDGAADILLLCEHASNHIPNEYDRLGLCESELQRHIAWDIGAAAVARRLSSLIDAPAFLGTYSRLLIDLNRPLDARDSIPTRSESTDIPGNFRLGAAEVQLRAAVMFTPYHDRVAAQLDRRQQARQPTRLVSIHSFTPAFLGVSRPWHAGVLFDRAGDFGKATLERLRSQGLCADANVPYRTDRLGDYAIPRHGDDRAVPAIMIEIRNDLISDAAGVEEWALRVAAVIALPMTLPPSAQSSLK